MEDPRPHKECPETGRTKERFVAGHRQHVYPHLLDVYGEDPRRLGSINEQEQFCLPRHRADLRYGQERAANIRGMGHGD